MRPDGDYDIYYPTKSAPATDENNTSPGPSTAASQVDSGDSDLDTDFEYYDTNFFSTESEEPKPGCSYSTNTDPYPVQNYWKSY